MLETVEFAAQGDRTRMKLDAKVVAVYLPEEQAKPFLDGMPQGFKESIEQLAEVVKKG